MESKQLLTDVEASLHSYVDVLLFSPEDNSLILVDFNDLPGQCWVSEWCFFIGCIVQLICHNNSDGMYSPAFILVLMISPKRHVHRQYDSCEAVKINKQEACVHL